MSLKLNRWLRSLAAAAVAFNAPGLGAYQAWADAPARGLASTASRRAPELLRLGPAFQRLPSEKAVLYLPGVGRQIYEVPILRRQVSATRREPSLEGIQQVEGLASAVSAVQDQPDQPAEFGTTKTQRAWENVQENVAAPSDTVMVKGGAGRPLSLLRRALRSAGLPKVPQAAPMLESRAVAALGVSFHQAVGKIAGLLKQALDRTGAAALGLARQFASPSPFWKSVAAASALAARLIFVPPVSHAGRLDLDLFYPNFQQSLRPTADDRRAQQAPEAETDPWRYGSVMQMNGRLVSPKFPGYERQIQDGMYAFLEAALEGRAGRMPVRVEFWMTPDTNGSPKIHEFHVNPIAPGSYLDSSVFTATLGLLPAPLGLQNDYAMGKMNTLVTAPLLWAATRNQDLFLRVNSPRPLMGAGYTDLGAMLSWKPDFGLGPRGWGVSLRELTAAFVNGPTAIKDGDRNRAFVDAAHLNVNGPSPGGVWLDTDNDGRKPFASNSNAKTVVGRAVFGVGQKIAFGASAMSGYYDLESSLRNDVYTAHFVFTPAPDWKLTAEAGQSKTAIRMPMSDASGAVSLSPGALDYGVEKNRGYYVLLDFPFPQALLRGQKVLGAASYSSMGSDAPYFAFASTHDPATNLPIRAHPAGSGDIHTSLSKWAVGAAWRMTDYFSLRYTHDFLNFSGIPSVGGVVQRSNSDDIVSAELRFGGELDKIFRRAGLRTVPTKN